MVSISQDFKKQEANKKYRHGSSSNMDLLFLEKRFSIPGCNVLTVFRFFDSKNGDFNDCRIFC